MEEFEAGFARIAGRFARVEPRRRARLFLLGLLSDVDTRSCWQLAEQAGDRTPHRMQRLLGEAVWDADKVRDDVRRYAVGELGDPGAVLILDDTGDLKAGVHTIGVQRQYTGTAGRIENAQVAVFLAYASRHGYTLIDREIYLPRRWSDDPARLAGAGVPASVRFATKITLARRMLARTLDAGAPAAWCTADEFYGGDRALRRDLQARDLGYVLAVARNHRVTACPAIGPQRVDQVVAGLSSRAWNRYSAGEGAKGAREYDWAWVAITPPDDEPAGHHTVLVRRSLTDGELAFYRCWSPTPVGLPTLVRVARHPLVHRDLLPDRERRGRPGRAPGPPMGLLVPLHHPGHARPRNPHRDCRPGTRPNPTRQPTADPVDCQRNPPPVRQTGRQHRPHHRPLAGLVPMAPRPARTSTSVHVTIPGWTTRCLRTDPTRLPRPAPGHQRLRTVRRERTERTLHPGRRSDHSSAPRMARRASRARPRRRPAVHYQEGQPALA